ncbi:MAG: 2-iminoacetate synthase ThiH [Deltaproteobacteria bacterium]|jgi:2-iminoacetate synthase|nr:2-iminoacetate synthase ThiH [Deltaproteobacteria bacterium]
MNTSQLTICDIERLLCNDSEQHLERLAQAAHQLTVQRFGRTIKLYAPVYLSNECINGCLYCGFNANSTITRKTLSVDEAIAEVVAITEKGHRHILLVAGEHPTKVSLDYLCKIASSVRERVSALSIEVQPFDEMGYRQLIDAGVDGVTLYQETYNKNVYKTMHPTGQKSVYGARLEAIDSAGCAATTFLGIGALLGLSDWRKETLALISHARELLKKHWRSHLTVSVPRIRDCASGFNMPSTVTDRDLAHMICVLRLALPDCGIILSTREPAELRNKFLPLGITQMSAGSVTSPGGYSNSNDTGEQFHLEDNRSPDTVAYMLKQAGYDPIWKDWEYCNRKENR